MPMYKNCGIVVCAVSLADKGKPGAWVPFASVVAWVGGSFRLAWQATWVDLELPSFEAAKAMAQKLAQRAIDSGEVRRACAAPA